MHGTHLTHIDDPGAAKVPPGLPATMLGLGVVGLVVFFLAAFGVIPGSSVQQVWAGLVISYLFFWTISMGAASFLAINYIVGAKWYIVLKRPLESLAAFSYKGGFLFPLLALYATGILYPWAQADATYPYQGTLKHAYLTHTAHCIKITVYVAILTGMTWLLVRGSTAGDKSPDPAFRAKQLRISIIYMILFAPVFSLFCLDVIKSLEPRWFSTMFGVYCFAGGFVSAMACTMLMAFWLRSKVPHAIHARQMHDIGTYVMAFSVFMVYIGFSQFMLIWYANIPDETFYYMARYEGAWLWLTLALPVLKWVIPFFLLMPPPFRTNVWVQSIVCGSILVGQFCDIYWMVAPAVPLDGNFAALEVSRQAWAPDLVNFLTFFGVAGVFGWSTLGFLGSNSVLPMSDPDLLNSVNGEYLHA